MDLVDSIKEACDSIEGRIYEINSILREKHFDEKLILELDSMVSVVKNIKDNVNSINATNARSELLNIQHELDELFEKAIKTR